MQGICHHAQGNWDIWCLSDGAYTFDAADFPGVSEGARDAHLAAAGLSEIQTAFNAFLLRDAEGAYSLIDCGCGALYGKIAGKLGALLDLLEVTPAQIRRLIFTHLHGDHCGGALDNTTLVFPNAQVILHADEAAFWRGEDAFARDVLAAYAGQTRIVQDDQEIAMCLRTVALPGHTPGHMGVLIDGKTLIAGDIVHSEALQFPDPEVCSVHDMDPPVAIASRKRAMGMIVDEGLVFSGGHILAADKFARLARDGRGFTKVTL